MKITVNFDGGLYVIPCGDGNKTIDWLINETVRRVEKVHGGIAAVENTNHLHAKTNKTHGILTKEDQIIDVLDDNELVYIDLIAARPHNTLNTLYIDGNSLTPMQLVKCGKCEYYLKITDESKEAVNKSRKLIEIIVEEKKVVYGVNTGFGKFAKVIIENSKLQQLQLNLIRSHAVCVGDILSTERARTILALRINVLAKGYSGISLENLERMVAIFNSGCVSEIPEKGTVGASGDLGPLAHLALGMIGEGKMWGPKTGWENASTVLLEHGLKPLVLGAKEGLALINGTQFITAIGCEALERAKMIARQADVVAAISLEVLKGTTKAFAKEIHNVRPHKGQKLVASRLRSLLHSEVYNSEVAESHRFCTRVQDAYTLRCTPQVHGITHDTIQFVDGIISVEVNSATDNPMVFSDIGETMSGGNFHGEYPAKALDYLAIGVHELANMSERRIERLVNPAYSELPAFLAKNGGLNSGFMLAHCTAAALVSENKVLTHPSSVDSLTTSAGTEDHVSMGGFAARKAMTVVEHVEFVLAIELLASCQGLEFLRPLKTTPPLEAVYRLVRSVVESFEKDRYMAPDVNKAVELLRDGKVWEVVLPYMKHYDIEIKKSYPEFVTPDSPTGFSCPSSPANSFTEEPPMKRPKALESND